MKTSRQAVADAAQRLRGEYAARDAELLLMHALKITRASLLANPQRELTHKEETRFDAMVAERATGKPIQYITGVQEFYGLEFAVTPDVLIPRPETEHLVEAVLARVSCDKPLSIADVGTGSGAIAIALAHALPLAQVQALDISEAALEVGLENAMRHCVVARVQFVQSDLFSLVWTDDFDVVVSNPPYIPLADAATLEPQVRDFEPQIALFGGEDGLAVYRELIPQAAKMVRLRGLLVMEIGYGQREQIAEMLREPAGLWHGIKFLKDLQGIERVVVARRTSLSLKSPEELQFKKAGAKNFKKLLRELNINIEDLDPPLMSGTQRQKVFAKLLNEEFKKARLRKVN